MANLFNFLLKFLISYGTVCGVSVVHVKMWVIHICTRGPCCVTTLKQYDTVCGTYVYVDYDKVWLIHICTRGLCCVTTLKHCGILCGKYVVYDKCR